MRYFKLLALSSNVGLFLQHRRRLLLPLVAIVSIVGIAISLLLASQIFERDRQRRRLISDTLWAEQAVSYEVQRLFDALASMAQPGKSGWPDEDEFTRRGASLIMRSPEVLRIYYWQQDGKVSMRYPVAWSVPTAEPAIDPSIIDSVGRRAMRLGRAASLTDGLEGEMLLVGLPVKQDHANATAIVALVSLHRLLVDTIPWWFAHETQLTLDDPSGAVLGRRDVNVIGRGIYTHKIASQFADRTLYLNANSSQGSPSLIPNLLTASIAFLALLLAWTVYALWRDLVRRTKAENALREQIAFRSAMEGSMVTGLVAREMDGRICYANPAFCDLVGYSMNEIVSMHPPYIFWPSAHPTRQGFLHVPLPAYEQYESALLTATKKRVDVLVHEAPLLDGSDRQIGWMASMLDISERKRDEEFLRQQNDRMHRMSRLMTMGEMASALAHELNQPLSAVNSYIMAGLNTMGGASDDRRVREAVVLFQKAKAQTDRAGTIIRRVRQFVGQSGPIVSALALEEVLDELLPLIKLQATSLDEVSLLVDRDLGPVMADRVLLEQIILNLTKNAFEAMAEFHAAQRRVIVCARQSNHPDQGILLSVRDFGPGMAADHVETMARSFSTTKPQGLGMGLAVCRTALELMGSRLCYSAAHGGGAEFKFILRRASAPAGSIGPDHLKQPETT